jgi:hypothetical protein
VAELASAVPLPDKLPSIEDLEVKLVSTPKNEKVRTIFFRFLFWFSLKR